MTEIFVKDASFVKCDQCFPGRLHLIIDFPEKDFPREILEIVARALNPLGIRAALLDR